MGEMSFAAFVLVCCVLCSARLYVVCRLMEVLVADNGRDPCQVWVFCCFSFDVLGSEGNEISRV